MSWKLAGLTGAVLLAASLALPFAGCVGTTRGTQPVANHQMMDHRAMHAEEYPLEEAPYLKENDAAMSKMMKDMNVMPSGDVDRDFVAMMVPHHQGAIDMAEAVLKYGRNEQIRRLAQEIVVTQQEEIAAMRMAVQQPLPPSAAVPTNPK